MQYRPRRKPTDYSVTLLSDAGETTVLVVNITSDGARVRTDCAQQFMPETPVDVVLRGKRYAANVIWADQGEAGLDFVAPLPKDVLTLIARDSRYRAR